MVVRLQALSAGRRYLLLISVRGKVDPKAIARLKVLRPVEKSSALIGNKKCI
jgi:hypothetical protein